MKYLLTACTLLFLVVITECEEKNNPTYHKSFNRRELANTFGVNHHDNVPKYQSTKVSGLRKLKDNHHESLTLTLNAFGNDFKFHVSLNKDLVAQTHTVEFHGKDGNVTKYHGYHGQFSFGIVEDDPTSYVSLHHTGKGVSGSIRTKNDLYIVNPLPHRLKNQQDDHIIYRASDLDEGHFAKKYVDELLDNKILKHGLRKRRAVTSTRKRKTVELLLAADYKMLAFFTKDVLPSYLLGVANIMAGFFRDPTMLYPLHIVVVRTAIFETNLFSPTTLNMLLDKFTQWNYKNNDMDDKSHNHYDLGLLLTKNGCDDTCQLEGLAYTGTYCTNKALGVAKDRGLLSAITLSHEMGHVLSAPHDGESIRCTDGINIMATGGVQGGLPSMKWSECAASRMERTLLDPYSKCFDDEPPTVLADGNFQLYGTIYNATQQCQFIYGPKYQRCTPYMDRCDSLFCQHKEHTSTCESILFPPVHGTPCADYKWCIDAACVPSGKLPPPKVDGAWSVWGEYQPCTKSCDVGVQWRVRHCNNPPPANGGKWCTPNVVREVPELGHYKTCNTQGCPATKGLNLHSTERNNQCKKIKDSLVFCSYCGGVSPCQLVCGSSSYSGVLQGYVLSGTHCKHSSTGIAAGVCAHGVCKEIGCDNNIDSGLAVDRCGVCGGDGTTCQHIHAERLTEFPKTGHNFFLTIPVKSFNVDVKEKAKTANFISATVGTQYSYSIKPFDRYKSIDLGNGAHMTYQMTGWPNQDEIKITGKTNVEVHLWYVNKYYRQSSKGVEWDYYLDTPQTKDNNYEWTTEAFSACSSSCAGGTQYRRVYCRRADDKSRAVDVRCDQTIKPIKEQACQEQNCPAKWHLTSYSACTLSCGHGTQKREIFCAELDKARIYQKVDDSKCSGDKPTYPTFSHCNSVDCPAKWEAITDFTACSKSCEGGVYSRTVACRRLDKSGKTITVSEMECTNANVKPVSTEKCNEDVPCPKWKIQYSKCSVTCGSGVLQPNIYCVEGSSLSTHLPFEKCDLSKKPTTSTITMKDCNLGACNGYAWGFKDGVCSVSCGNGTIPASIGCYDKVTRRIYPDYKCVEAKPTVPTPKACNQGVCEQIFTWRNDFKDSTCSTTCGEGNQKSKPYCVNGTGTAVTDIYCNGANKPKVLIKKCTVRSCPLYDWVFNYGDCSVSCGTGQQVGVPVCKTIATSTIVLDKNCEEAKPSIKNKECTLNKCPAPSSYKWELKDIGCTKTCGGGVIATESVCYRMDSEIKYTKVNPTNCDQKTKPTATMKICNAEKCPATHKWKIVDTYCHVGCSKGYNGYVLKCVELKSNEYVLSVNCKNVASAPNTCHQANNLPINCKALKIGSSEPFYPLGCFAEDKNNRKIPTFFADYTNELSKKVGKCHEGATSVKAPFFAVGDGGLCYTGTTSNVNVDAFVNAQPTDCVRGVGKSGFNYIFHVGSPLTKIDMQIVRVGCRRLGSTDNGNYVKGTTLEGLIMICGPKALVAGEGYFGGNSRHACLTKAEIDATMKASDFSETCFDELEGETQHHIYKFHKS